MKKNTVYYKDSRKMIEVDGETVDLILTSPPYYNIKNYSLNITKQTRKKGEIGNTKKYKQYINDLLEVWKECSRVLKPNGKLVINVPLMPLLKKESSTHYNRDILNIQSDIQHSIINSDIDLYIMDIYIWNRTNSSKSLMFGSYPFPSNFYAQNTCEFIIVFVKDGKPEKRPKEEKNKSKLTKEEWVNYTKQIWDIPIPNKKDKAYGKHSALMPEEIAKRIIKMYSFEDDIVLDPFTGSGTTLKIAKLLKRNYLGYEIYKSYKKIIEVKLNES